MSKNKLIPELRFPEFKNEGQWEEKVLEDVADSESSSLALNKIEHKENGYPVYGADSIVGYINEFQQEEKYISIVKDGSGVGRLNLCEPKSSILGTLACIKSKDLKKYNLDWIYYQMNTIDFSSYKKGSGIPHIYFSDFKKEPIGLPNPQEQQKIASCLSSLDEVIAAHSQKLELLKDHKKGLMQNLFPQEGETVPNYRFKEFEKDGEWMEKKLNFYLELLTDFEANGSFANVKNNVTVYDEKKYAWYVRATDLENNTDLSKVKYVDKHSYNFLHKTQLFGGELLITKRGEIGKVYIYNSIGNLHATVAPNMYLLKLNKKAIPLFFYYHFTNFIGNHSLRRLNASSTIGALYKDDVKKLELLAPPTIEEQQKIASCLSSLDTLITAQAEKIEQLQLHKKGLMQGLFPKIES